MKYDPQAEFDEILRRGKTLKKKKDRRKLQVLTGCSAALLVLLILGIGMFARQPGTTESVHSVYGAFLLPTEAGGYILAAVIAFTLGVTVTAMILHKRRIKEEQEFSSDNKQNAEGGSKNEDSRI